MKVLITAGATREFFDPVRYISNPSSGKMGYAMAEAAQKMGLEVDLISGPVALSAPAGTRLHKVVTGEEMLVKAQELFPQCDILIKAAAVCDFRPKHYDEHKLKKNGNGMTVEFEATTDILKTLSASRREGQTLVGFAAETQNIEDYALKKLREKNLDLIVANLVGRGNVGAFEADNNSVVLLGRLGFRKAFGPDSKIEIAKCLMREILDYRGKLQI